MRGTAWKEHANALVRLGKLEQALESARRAERAYSRLSSSGHSLATLALLRAAIFYQGDELAEAAEQAEQAERGYAHIGQEHLRMKAVHFEGAFTSKLWSSKRLSPSISR